MGADFNAEESGLSISTDDCASETINGIPTQEIRAEIEKICTSPTFAQCDRLGSGAFGRD
jgi:hypothetical protein